jgi:hypothetical protein
LFSKVTIWAEVNLSPPHEPPGLVVAWNAFYKTVRIFPSLFIFQAGSYPNFSAVWRCEEGVVCRAIEAIGLFKYWASLIPRRSQKRVAPIPMKKSQGVVGGSTIGTGIAKPEIFAMYKGLFHIVSNQLIIAAQGCTYVRGFVDTVQVLLRRVSGSCDVPLPWLVWD